MSDFLGRMAASSRARMEEARRLRPDAELRAAAEATPSPTPLMLHARFDVIAEIKPRSPAEGALERTVGPPLERARQYAAGGAAALSVLTEPEAFDGTLEDLSAVGEAVATPVLRKDFLVDAYQVWEAKVAGAAGVLLIARMLPGSALSEIAAAARALGMFVLAEAFDAPDLERIGRELDPVGSNDGSTPPVLVGVNTRDLTTLRVDPLRLERVRPALPDGCVAVAESGITNTDDVRRAVALGYRMALVGTALMRAPDAQRAVAGLIAAGREGGGA
ncbi:MAG: indole-3-glycerol phosphate synthase TrpC [Gemmatimonadota bacterium]